MLLNHLLLKHTDHLDIVVKHIVYKSVNFRTHNFKKWAALTNFSGNISPCISPLSDLLLKLEWIPLQSPLPTILFHFSV